MSTQMINEAIEHTRSLVDVMEQENVYLSTNERGEKFEDIIKQKRALAAKVEKLLSEIKQVKHTFATNPEAKQKLPELEVVVNDYQITARKNVILLQAAHQATVDVLDMFRRAVNKLKPSADTYNKQGQMSDNTSAGSILTKSV